MWLQALATTLLVTAAEAAADPTPLRVAVHVDTSVSHSTRTVRVAGIPVRTVPGELPQPVEDIARMARDLGLDAVLLADRARSDVSYALTPFSRLLKVTVSEGSVASYGAKRYLARVRAAEARFGVLLIPGAECIPYYRWEGDPLTGLRLKHLYEHMALCGLESAEDFENIPDTAGGYGYRFSWTVLLNLLPPALVVFGVRGWRRRGRRRCVGGVLVALGLVIAIDAAPFLPRRISAYGTPDAYPPNILCEYARSRGALAFWAHPDANPGSLPERLRESSGIDIEVRPYPDVLTRTRDYDGFAMFNAGIRPGEPGGAWDRALRQYCAGERERPVWVLSECDFDAESPPDGLTDAQTVVWAKGRAKEAILEALRAGRCYATRQSVHKEFEVRRYRVTAGDRSAGSGETLAVATPTATVHLRLRADVPEATRRRLNVKLVVNGEAHVVPLQPVAGGEVEIRAPVAIDPDEPLSYVRALVCDGDEAILALNPVFLSRRPRKPSP